MARVYFYWTPHSVGGTHMRNIGLENLIMTEKGLMLVCVNVTTNFVPFGLNFFHASGLYAAMKGTYFNQTAVVPLLTTFPGRNN